MNKKGSVKKVHTEKMEKSSTINNKKPVNYKVYIMNRKEKFICAAKYIGILAVVSYLFYASIISFLLLLPYLFFAFRKERERLRQARLCRLRSEFKEGIQAVLAALDTGYSVENAFVEALKDLRMIYPEETYIITEFKWIAQGIRMNKPVEELLEDFAKRSGLEDIRAFAEIFSLAKRSGGDLLLIIRSSVQTIREKIEVQNEIQTMIAGKRLEQKLMNVIPFAILAYVRVTSAELLSTMYGNVMGVAIMTVCLAVYVAAVQMAGKIIAIEV